MSGNIYGGPGTGPGAMGGAERPLNVIVKNVVWAQLRDASGNEIGTATNPIYTTGTGSGGATPVSGDVNVLDPCKGTQTNNIDVDVQSSALPAGAATAANQGTANTHLSNIRTDTQSIDGKITACNTGAIVGTVTANAGTNLNTSALALESGGVLDSIDGKITACNTGAIAGTVTANAGTNLNTSALALESGGVLDSIDSKITACDTDDVTISAMPDVFVQHGRRPVFYAKTGTGSVAIDTAFMLIDLSNASGKWPHTNTGSIVLQGLAIEIDPNNFNGSVHVGFISRNDATDGDLLTFKTYALTNKSGTIDFECRFDDLYFTAANSFTATITSTTLRTGAALVGPDGATYAPQVGDMCILIERTGGSVISHVCAPYETDA